MPEDDQHRDSAAAPAPQPGRGGGRAPDGGPYNPGPTAGAAAELAIPGQLARLRRDLTERHDQLRRELEDSRAAAHRDAQDLVANLRRETVDTLTDRFRAFTNTLEAHETALQQVLRRQRENANPPVAWHDLDHAQAAEQWTRLADWVDQVFVPWGQHTRDELPDCWPMHRSIVVQLSWLRTAHVQAYLPDTDPSAAADWHVRWCPAVLTKIRKAINPEMCRPGEHMIDKEESNRRRREAMGRGPQPPGPPPGQGLELAREQLATRQYWDAFYHDARDRDLGWRTAGGRQPER